MSDRIRTSLLSLTITIVLVLSAVSPTIAYADDGAPPEQTSTEAAGETSTEEETAKTQPAEEAAPVEKSTETQPAEGATEAPPTEQALAEEQTPLAPDASVLSEVPENTAVTVLDANGEAQPLVTQEAAEAIATSDPIWCPGTQTPTPGDNGCTESFTSFDDLLTHLSGNPAYSGAGTIYVQQGAYHGDDPGNVIDFNSPNYNLSNINNANLTVTGGWNTSNNTIDPNSPSMFSNYSILIGSDTSMWGGTVNINNISMNLSGVNDPAVNGLTVHATGDINVSNVSVSMAPNNGAEFHADGDVNMRDSRFERNQQAGVLIRSMGNVSIANSTFGNPREDAGRRQNFGLDVESGEMTSLFAVIANNNREAGVTINAGDRVIIGSSFFSSTKDRLRPRSNPTFLGYGLQVTTPDAIDIDNVEAIDNFLWGVRLDAGGDISISNSRFNENSTDEPGFIDDTGLFITRGANVALNNVEANDNRLYGAQINVSGTVSINNSNFNNNRGIITTGGVTTYHGHGLQINTLADIFIDNTNAVNNMLFGGELTAGGQVTISNSNFNQTSTGLAEQVMGRGLDITSTGNTSLASVVLDSNQTVGADIQAEGDVYLDLVTATNNGTDGVSVQSRCTHVFVGTYSGNGRYGLNFGNSGLDLVSPPTAFNNGEGNFFPEIPANCVPASGGNPPVVPPVTPPVIDPGTAPVSDSAGTANPFASNFSSETANSGSSSDKVSLNSYLANTRTGKSSLNGIFIGKYVYVHLTDGLQIFALTPASENLAMSTSFR